MVRVRTERCHGFTTLAVVLGTAFKSLVALSDKLWHKPVSIRDRP
jgi:hypothetical protein